MAIIKNSDLVVKGAEKAFDPIIEKYKELDKLQDGLIDSSKAYQDVLNSIKKTNDGKEAKQLVAINEKLVKTNAELTAIDKERIKLDNQKQQLTAKLITAGNKQNQLLAKGKQQLKDRNELLKAEAVLNNKLAGTEEKLLASNKKLRIERKKLNSETATGRKRLIEINAAIDRNNVKLKQNTDQLTKQKIGIGKYSQALKGLGSQLLGAAGIVGGVQLLIDGFREFAETSKQVNDLTRKISTNFNLFGKEAKTLAANINAIASTFEQDYNEVLIAANTVSKEFGITGAKATKLIEEGFLKGSNNSGEFLDILKEYPAQFKSVGIDAETSFAIINQQVKEGIYSDKGVDAIKEAGLRLRENTKAVQESLKPLDDSIKAQIKQEIAAGNSFKAIQLVSKALKDTSLSAEQTQKIIADVFGGPGEDAGLRYLQTLSDINTNLEDVAIQSSESEQATLKLSKSWNTFVAGVSDSEGSLGKVFAFLKNSLSDVLDSLSGLVETSKAASSETATLDEKLSNAFDTANNGNVIVKQLKFLWDGLVNTFVQAKNAILDLLGIEREANESRKLSNNLTKLKITRQATSIEGDKKEKDEIIKLTSAQKKQIQAQKELNAERKRRENISTENKQLETITTSFSATGVTGGFDPIKSAKETTKAVNDVIEKENSERRERERLAELALAEGLEDAKKELLKSTTDEVASFLTDNRQSQKDDEIAAINERAEAEKEILRQKLEAGLITETEFKKKSEDIDKKARKDSAKAEKQANLFNIGINTAAGIVKALASSPPPLNFINAGLIAAQGAIQAALVAAKPLPAFADGTESVPLGNNKKGKDTIIARVNEGERIIPTHLNNKIPSGVTNEMLPDVINRGLFLNNPPGMTTPQKDSLLASLLMQGNRQGEQVLTALLNGMGHTRPGKNFDTYTNARGEIQKIYK